MKAKDPKIIEQNKIYRWLIIIVTITSIISTLFIYKEKISSWYKKTKLKDAMIEKIEMNDKYKGIDLSKSSLGLIISDFYLNVGKVNGVTNNDFFKVLYFKNIGTKKLKDYKAVLRIKEVRDNLTIAQCLWISTSCPHANDYNAISENDKLELITDDGNTAFAKILNLEEEIQRNKYIYHIGSDLKNQLAKLNDLEKLYKKLKDENHYKKKKFYDQNYFKFKPYYFKDELAKVKVKEYASILNSFFVQNPKSFWKEAVLEKNIEINFELERYVEVVNGYNLFYEEFPNNKRIDYFKRITTISSLRDSISRNPHSDIHAELANFISENDNVSMVNFIESVVEYYFAFFLSENEAYLDEAKKLIEWHEQTTGELLIYYKK
jgi:hypothetical protein